MPAYLIASLEVTDPALYGDYSRRVAATVHAHGGRFIVAVQERVDQFLDAFEAQIGPADHQQGGHGHGQPGGEQGRAAVRRGRPVL